MDLADREDDGLLLGDVAIFLRSVAHRHDEWSSQPSPRYDPDPSGAVAQLAKAPVSKTGDSRFESWLPRYSSRPPGARPD